MSLKITMLSVSCSIVVSSDFLFTIWQKIQLSIVVIVYIFRNGKRNKTINLFIFKNLNVIYCNFLMFLHPTPQVRHWNSLLFSINQLSSRVAK